MQNGIAGIALGAYLLAVAYQGNATNLLHAVEQERGYIKWGVAALLLYWAWENDKLRPFVAPLVIVAVIANLTKIGSNGELTNVQKGLKTLWDTL